MIIYLLLSEKINQTEVESSLFNSKKFASLQKAIDEYYAAAFSPEILQALNFVEKSKIAAEIISKHAKLTGEKASERQFSHGKFQTNLFYIQKHFEDALLSIKPSHNYILFIDGIDIRPRNVEFDDYLECIKGLANAIWSINNDLFSKLKGGKSIKVMMLVRPDIYTMLGLQNQNNKLRDNGIFLNWITTFGDFETSPLFILVDKLLNAQQPFYNYIGECWNYYFPYKVQNSRTGKYTDNSFVSFLRFSYYKPRDFVSMMSILQGYFIAKKRKKEDVFRKEDFDSMEFRKEYSEYLLSEIKDQILFYYTEEEYQLLYDFFQFLNGKIDFDYNHYLETFSKYSEYLTGAKIELPKYLASPEIFLQFLFDNNIIAYIEDTTKESFMRWCFRERNYSNINPKILYNARYTIHYGLHKALNLGSRTFTSNQRTSRKKQNPTNTKKQN